MTARFLKIFPWLIQWEGTTYENDRSDPGGATKYGIDQRSHPKVNIKALTLDQAQQIYWDEYWQKNDCENRGYPLGEVFFNCCVNCGRSRADILLAQARGVDANHKADSFLDAQDAFYRRLAAARPSSKKYLKGWLNRTADLRKFLNIT